MTFKENDMNCQDTVRYIHEYLDGDLDPALAAKLEAHLQTCERCRTFCQSYRKTIQLFKKTWDFELPPEKRRSIWRSLESKIQH